MLSRLFSLRLTRCQVNDCKPGCTPAHPEQRRSRAKAQHTEWTHVAPPAKGWGGIQRVYLAYTPGHGPKVDRLQKGPSHSQVWSMDGFLDA